MLLYMKDALFFALLVVIVGNIAGFFVGATLGVDLPPVCKKWNQNYIMEISLFITGFVSYLVFKQIPRKYIK